MREPDPMLETQASRVRIATWRIANNRVSCLRKGGKQTTALETACTFARLGAP
jgi:hypothetical protein